MLGGRSRGLCFYWFCTELGITQFQMNLSNNMLIQFFACVLKWTFLQVISSRPLNFSPLNLSPALVGSNTINHMFTEILSTISIGQ